MTGIEWLVVALSAAAIGWVNWYFFVAGRSADASRADVRAAATEGERS